MMVKKMFIGLCLCVIAVPMALLAQDYDYHREESPAVSWNGLALFDARMLAVGGISLMASPAYSAAINPALLPGDDGVHLGVSIETMRYQAFQYWGVNQGVVGDPDPQTGNNFYLSGGALTFPFKNFRFSAGWYVANLLELPEYNYSSQYWSYSVKSTGIENNFFAAAAFKLGKSLDIGVKLDVVYGKRDVEVIDNYIGYPAFIRQSETHRLNYFIPSIGAVLEISPAWSVGAVFIKPLQGDAKRTIDRVFESNYTRIELLDQKSTDTLYRPTRFSLGTTFAPLASAAAQGSKKLILAAEMVYTLWSDYKYEFYEEILPREMRNTLALALGMEYNFREYSVRVGYRMDPQPIKDPQVTLHAVTGGLGMRLGNLSFDAGAAYYFGSLQWIKQKHLILNGTLIYSFGR